MFLFLLIYNPPRTDEFAFVDQNDFKLDVLSDADFFVKNKEVKKSRKFSDHFRNTY